jgi:hypothetical protein
MIKRLGLESVDEVWFKCEDKTKLIRHFSLWYQGNKF